MGRGIRHPGLCAALLLCAALAAAAGADALRPAGEGPADSVGPAGAARDGLAPNDAGTADAGSAEEVAAGWAVACGDRLCQINRSLSEANTGRRVLGFTVTKPIGGNGARLAALLPLGIDVRAEVWLRGSRDVRAMEVETCVIEGCIATTDVDETSLGLIASQELLAFEFLPYMEEETLTIELPIDGLMTALEALPDGTGQ